MPYEIKLETEPPMVHVTLGEVMLPGEIRSLVAEAYRMLDEAPYPIYNVVEALSIHAELADILDGVSVAVRGKTPSLLHPNVIETLVVTRDRLVITAIKGLNVPTFSNVKIAVFETFDEVLAYIAEKTAPAE